MRGTIERLVFLLESSSGEAGTTAKLRFGHGKQNETRRSRCLSMSVCLCCQGCSEAYGSLCSAFTETIVLRPCSNWQNNGDFRQVQAPACRALERIACASKTGARLVRDWAKKQILVAS